jgi:hypothetical protein
MKSDSKVKAIRKAKREGRKVLWKDDKGEWHAATDRFNTPHWATETEDVESDRKV